MSEAYTPKNLDTRRLIADCGIYHLTLCDQYRALRIEGLGSCALCLA